MEYHSRLQRTGLAGAPPILLLCLVACSPATTVPADALSEATDTNTSPAFLAELLSLADYERMAAGIGGVKFTLPSPGAGDSGPLTESCYFMNMHIYRFHLEFLRTFEGWEAMSADEYQTLAWDSSNRQWWSGTLRWWNDLNPSADEEPGFMTFEVYHGNGRGGGLTLQDIIAVDRILKQCAPFAAGHLAFLPSSASSSQLASTFRNSLEAEGVTVVLPGELPGLSEVQTVSTGEGYGILNVVREGDELADYGPRDVVVVWSTPNEISVVSGLITAIPPSPLSHVTLRLAGLGIPFAVVPGVYQDAEILGLQGTLVHFVTQEGEILVEPAELDDAEAFWKSHKGPDIQILPADLTVRDLRDLDSLRLQDGQAFGAKAAWLGELAAVVPTENRPRGLGIPMVYYHEFVAATGLDREIDAMISNPAMRTNARFKRDALKALRQKFRALEIPETLLQALVGRLSQIFGPEVATLPLRFRSSGNAEDQHAFSWAGMYDSRRGCISDELDDDEVGPSACMSESETRFLQHRLDKARAEYEANPDRYWLPTTIRDLESDLAEEKSLRRALLGVWSSLWNERSWDTREFLGVDHKQVGMGVLVVPSFVLEHINAVAVTHYSMPDNLAAYRVVSQVGWESVSTPSDPTVIPEMMTFLRLGTNMIPFGIRRLTNSSHLQNGEYLWSDSRVAQLGELLFQVHDHMATRLSRPIDTFQLDVEIKLTNEGTIVLKQVRPLTATQW
jgi:hypothetical protein